MVKKRIAIEIILNMLFGKSSNLYKELSDKNMILGMLDLSYEDSSEYAFITITGVSRKPKEVIEKINQEIKKAISAGLNKEDFIRSKKKIYGDYIAEYNSVEESARMFLVDYFKNINSFDYLDKYDEVTLEYTEEIFKKVFDLEKEVYSIVKG